MQNNAAKKLDGVTSLSRTGNQSIFGTSPSPSTENQFLGTVRIMMSIDADSIVEVSFDGSTWDALNDNISLKGNTLYEFYLDLEPTDTINVRAKTAVTIKRCRLDQVF